MSTVLPDARANKNLEGPGFRARIQKFGGYLAGMIMPNIGAFIAWGLITALFIEKGWLPNATLAALVAPMLYFLLPILIGYTGGRMVHGQRGAVIGAIATAGVIMGGLVISAKETNGVWGVSWDGPPMFLGAMLMGPLAAWLLKLLDKSIEGKVPSGFEMLIDNFSLGILGMIMAIIGRLGIGPVVEAIVNVLSVAVGALVSARLLPLASIFVEPAKVLFLNNAINHGIFSPLGIQEVQESGRSILFMVESNPGAGLGLLLAYALFGPKSLRPSTPGAIIIHFFGGIHEIYFPYILMRPVLLLATIAGSMSGLFVGSLLGAGLVAPPAPGSIIAYMLVTPPGGHVPVLAAVAASTIVSFLVAAALMKFGRGSDDTGDAALTPEEAAPTAVGSEGATGPGVHGSDVRKVIIACDAGMGSSVMVASSMKKRLAPYGVEVTHTPVDQIPADAQVVLTQDGLADRARKTRPSAVVVPFTNYMGDPAFDRVEAAIRDGLPLGAVAGTATAAAAPATPAHAVPPAPDDAAVAPAARPKPKPKKRLERDVLSRDGVRLGLTAASKDDAIRQSGEVLVALGAAEPGYIDGMLARERQVSTFMGNGVAIPHGTNEARAHIRKAALGFLQFPEGVDWDGKTAYVAIPIASNSDEHIGILSALATVLADKDKAERLRTTSSVDEVLDLLAPEEE